MYKDYGPFRRWLHWLPEPEEFDGETTVEIVDHQLKQDVNDKDAQGPRSDGEWIGNMCFSPGVRMAARLLFTQRKRVDILDAGKAGFKLRCVTPARRAPLVTLDPELVIVIALPYALQSTLGLRDSRMETILKRKGTSYGCRQFMSTGNRTRVCICISGYWNNTASTVVPAWSSGKAIIECQSRRKM